MNAIYEYDPEVRENPFNSPKGIREICSELIIDDTSSPYVLTGVTQSLGENYIFGFWIKATSASTVTINGQEVEVGTDWGDKKVLKFLDVDTTDVELYFNDAVTYYIYHPKIELGSVDTDWVEAPEDQDQAVKTIQTNLLNVVAKDNEGNWYIQQSILENTYVYPPAKDEDGDYVLTAEGELVPDYDSPVSILQQNMSTIKTVDEIKSVVGEVETNEDGSIKTVQSMIDQKADSVTTSVTSSAKAYTDQVKQETIDYVSGQGYLTVDSDGIKALATKEEAQAYAYAATTDMATKEYVNEQGFLTVNSDAITALASKTEAKEYADAAASKIAVGGRNLISQSVNVLKNKFNYITEDRTEVCDLYVVSNRLTCV